MSGSRAITNLGRLRVALEGLGDEADAVPIVVNAGSHTLTEVVSAYHVFPSLGVGAECVELLLAPTCPVPRGAAQVVADLLPSMREKCAGDAVAAHFFGAAQALLDWVRTQEPAPREEW